jgi:hypothetical protein
MCTDVLFKSVQVGCMEGENAYRYRYAVERTERDIEKIKGVVMQFLVAKFKKIRKRSDAPSHFLWLNTGLELAPIINFFLMPLLTLRNILHCLISKFCPLSYLYLYYFYVDN